MQAVVEWDTYVFTHTALLSSQNQILESYEIFKSYYHYDYYSGCYYYYCYFQTA